MNVVLLSSNPRGGKAREILGDLIDAGVEVKAVLGERPRKASRRGELLWRLCKKELRGQLMARLLGKAKGVLSRRRSGEQSAQDAGKRKGVDCPVHYVDAFNSAGCVDLLRGLKADLLVLGGTGIIRKRILQVPGAGAVNVHMGLLPAYRGMNVAEWAFLNGDGVGLTVHFVDQGVDSGDIIAERIVDVSECGSIELMRAKLSRMQHVFLAQVVRQVIDRKAAARPQAQGEGRQYYVMHPILRGLLDEKLARQVI